MSVRGFIIYCASAAMDLRFLIFFSTFRAFKDKKANKQSLGSLLETLG